MSALDWTLLSLIVTLPYVGLAFLAMYFWNDGADS